MMEKHDRTSLSREAYRSKNALVSLILKYDLLHREELRETFRSTLFADGNKQSAVRLTRGCWEVILTIAKAHLTDTPTVVSDLCQMSTFSESTVKNHLRNLEKIGLIVKHIDENDHRRQFVELTKPYRDNLDEFVAECSEEFKELIELHDKCERDKAEEQLRSQEELFRGIMSAAMDAIVVMDDTGSIAFVNEAAEKMFGFERKKIIGKSLHKLIVSKRYYSAFEKGFAKFSETGKGKLIGKTLELPVLKMDGTEFYADHSFSSVNLHGKWHAIAIIRDTTERKRAELKLIDSQNELTEKSTLLQTTLESIDQGFAVWDDKNRLVIWNNKCMDFWLNPGSVKVGMTKLELLRHIAANGGLGSGNAEKLAKTRLRKLVAEGQDSTDEFKLPDGREIYVLRYPMPNGCHTAVYSDITKRKRAEEALKEREEKYRNLVETSNDLIWSVNTKGEFTFVNTAAKIILGYEPEEMIGKSLTFFKTPEQAKKDMKAFAKIKKGNKFFDYETEYRKKDGSFIPMSFNAVNVHDKDDNVLGTMGTARDITIRKRHENNLSIAKEQAEHSNNVKSEFITNMSHDLRTPLTAILGFSDLMLSEIFGKINQPRYGEYVADIRNSARYLLEMINDLLDIAKIEAGRMDIREEEVDVSDIIDFCLEIMTPHASSKKLELKREIPESVPLILGDRRIIRQMLLNLASNAVKFTPKNGWVAIWANTNKKGEVTLGVTDNGPGIASEDIKSIMEPYVRLESPEADQIAGTGLGVPLSKMMAELHDGNFEIESKLGFGTTVSITFPQNRILAG